MKAISKGSWKIMVWSSTLITLLIGYCITISPIVGSCSSFFSVSDLIMPLTGLFGMAFVWIGSTVRMLWFSRSLISFMAPVYHLPGICGAISWRRPTIFFRVILPLICMVAFSLHPIGRYAIPYTFYWFIPIVFFLLRRNSIFETSLACTFVTHAVGSVIWLYFKHIPVAVWWSLMPIVPFERLLSAAMMTGIYYGVQELISFVNKIKNSYKKSFIHFKNQI